MRYFSVLTAASEVGMKPQAVYAACKRGRIECTKDKSGLRISEDSLRAYVAEKRRHHALRGKAVYTFCLRVDAEGYKRLAAYSKAQGMSINCAVNEWAMMLPDVEGAGVEDDCNE